MGRFRDALAAPGLTAIAEVKRRSPSAGDLRPDADPAALAAAFEKAGAAAVSILVDERFAGTLDDLRAARAAAGLPLLAKGFFTDEAELDELQAAGAEAELAGADAVLVGTALMRAADPATKLRELVSRPLVKVCGLTREEDVAVAAEAGADLCGFILVDASPRRAPRVLPVPDDVLPV